MDCARRPAQVETRLYFRLEFPAPGQRARAGGKLNSIWSAALRERTGRRVAARRAPRRAADLFCAAVDVPSGQLSSPFGRRGSMLRDFKIARWTFNGARQT